MHVYFQNILYSVQERYCIYCRVSEKYLNLHVRIYEPVYVQYAIYA